MLKYCYQAFITIQTLLITLHTCSKYPAGPLGHVPLHHKLEYLLGVGRCASRQKLLRQ